MCVCVCVSLAWLSKSTNHHTSNPQPCPLSAEMQHSSAAQACENRMVKQHLHHSAYLHFTVQHAHTHALTHKLSLETEWYLVVFISRQPQVCICLFMQPMKASEMSQYYTRIKKCVFDTSLNIYYDAPITEGFVTCYEAILFHQSPKKKMQRGGNVYSADIFTVVFNNCNQYH